ncbi:MAG: hypothetical protein AB7D37_05540 [Desulfovibrio sp.]
MSSIVVRPDGYPKGRKANFDFQATSRNGNDLVSAIEEVILSSTITEFVQVLREKPGRARGFCVWVELQFRRTRS